MKRINKVLIGAAAGAASFGTIAFISEQSQEVITDSQKPAGCASESGLVAVKHAVQIECVSVKADSDEQPNPLDELGRTALVAILGSLGAAVGAGIVLGQCDKNGAQNRLANQAVPIPVETV